MLLKDDAEHPVPLPFRSTFKEIADAFVAGAFRLRDHPVQRVRLVSSETAQWIAQSVAAYGTASLH